jgi:hypothetical protein
MIPSPLASQIQRNNKWMVPSDTDRKMKWEWSQEQCNSNTFFQLLINWGEDAKTLQQIQNILLFFSSSLHDIFPWCLHFLLWNLYSGCELQISLYFMGSNTTLIGTMTASECANVSVEVNSLLQHNSNTQCSFYQTICCKFFHGTQKT